MRKTNNNKLCPVLNAKIMAQSLEDVPVIIQFKENNRNLIRDVSSLSSQVKVELPLISGLAANMSTDLIYRLSNNAEVDFISFDSSVYTLLDVSLPTIDAYLPHSKGYEGKGIGIAVIDTGVAPHDDLVNPNNRIIAFKDLVNRKTAVYDDNGHGTHVAGIIAGNGFSSKGKYLGIAPKANIIAIKALDENGGGSSSSIIEAISYIIETKDRYNIKIINLSVGTPATNDCAHDPLCKAVEKAIQAGLIVVVAAGNSGPDKGTILSPGTSKNAITVGAVDHRNTINPEDDTLATFSSRGPTEEGLIKPDIFAPGVNINSLSNTKLNSYTSLSGTSMATPLVSGSVALLLNKYGNLEPKQVKEMLINSSIELKTSNEKLGAGLLNLKQLFLDKEDGLTNKNPPGYNDFGGETLQNIIMLLVIVFLLDSRI